MAKLLQRSTLTALCLLGTALTYSLLVAALTYSLLVAYWSRSSALVAVHAQDAETTGTKTVVIPNMHKNDPIAVMRILDGTTLATGGAPSEDDLKWLVRQDVPLRPTWPWRSAFKFEAGDAWLTNLSIVVANRTGKRIVRIVLLVRFPEVRQSSKLEGGTAATIQFGQVPASVAYDVNGAPLRLGDEQPLDLRSGYEMPLSFAPDEPKLRSAVEKWQPFSTVSLCYVTISNVTFADGMNWSEAGYSLPDPEHLGRYLPMNTGYFPAARKQSATP